MGKISKKSLKDLWGMRHLTIKDFINRLSAYPDLKFFLTAVGIWWFARTVITVTIGLNVIYYICRLFNLVLG